MRATLLITRPAEAAKRVALAVEQAMGRDIPMVIAPVLRIRDLNPDAPKDAEPVLTSEHGARAAGRMGFRGRAWCVGERTAEVARDHGMTAISADADGHALIRLIKTHGSDRPLLHVRGTYMAVDIASELRAAGFDASDCEAYRPEEQPLTTAAHDLLAGDDPVIAPVFSPRSARILRSQIPDTPQNLRWVAISENAARLLPKPVRIAAHPGMAAMVAAICAEFSPIKAR